MKTKDWADVFAVYPEEKEIYVCDNMPFLEKSQAEAHSRSTGEPVETIKRPAEKKKTKAAKKTPAEE
jgi:hypothetical protein